MKETYLVVAGRIRSELDQIQEVAHRAQTIWAEAGAPKEGDYHLDAVALNLHGFYAGLEYITSKIPTAAVGALSLALGTRLRRGRECAGLGDGGERHNGNLRTERRPHDPHDCPPAEHSPPHR